MKDSINKKDVSRFIKKQLEIYCRCNGVLLGNTEKVTAIFNQYKLQWTKLYMSIQAN